MVRLLPVFAVCLFLTMLLAGAQQTSRAGGAGGGGPVTLPHDDDGPLISALNPLMVARARQMGLPVVSQRSLAPATFRSLQYPFRATRNENDLQSQVLSNHVDLDPTPGIKDFACGTRTYDGHTGTDIALFPYAWNGMDGLQDEVVASLGGTIIDKHDGEYDRQCSLGAGQLANYVIIRHTDGLLGYYWHLKKGTVTTKAIGATVATGEHLAYVGSSGYSTGPHLHFEIRDAQNLVVEPDRGACNVRATSWTHQGPNLDTTIIGVATHSSAPNNGTQCADVASSYQNTFAAGATVYEAVYLRDQKSGDKVTVQTFKPDGSLFYSWQSGSPAAGFYPASYWYASLVLPGAGATGIWRVRSTLGAKIAEHAFTVGARAGAAISLLIASPAGNLSAGHPADFVVTVNSAGSAYGCQLAVDRPILAEIKYRRLSATGVPVGLYNQAFNVPAGGHTDLRLTVSPKAGFAASAARFPVRATCSNSLASADSAPATQLVLTSP